MSAKTVNIQTLLQGMIAESTIKLYALAWKDYLAFAGSLDDTMVASTLTRWRQHLVTERKLAAGTINYRLIAIKTIARELYANGKIDRATLWDIKEVRNLPATALKERRRAHNRTRIEPEQMRAICTAPKVDVDKPIELRDRALMMTLATTGMRISEVLNVKVRDILTLPGGFHAIDNVLGKNKSQPRTVPLSAEAHSCLMDWLAFRPVSSPFVFTAITYCVETEGLLYGDRPISRNVAGWHVKRVAESLGIPHVKPHDFRRFVGTQLAKTNLRAAQKVLGHADISTTAKYYVMDDVPAGITEGLF